MQWPTSVLDIAKVEQLRSQGLGAVLGYIYTSIVAAAASQQVAEEVTTIIRRGVHNAPSDGVLNLNLSKLGFAGANQVAQLIEQAMFTGIPRMETPDRLMGHG